MNSRIFISYSRKDLEVARRVAEDVRSATGEVPWVDILGIETGTQFEDVIVRAIDSCEILLFLLSENSLRSEWTKKEVLYARNRKKRIFPIIVDGTELSGWFLFEFGYIDCIDYRSSDLRQKLMRDLCGNLGHEKSVSSMTKSEKSSRGRAGIPRRCLLFLLLGGLLFVVVVGTCWLGLRGGKNIQDGASPSVGNVPEEKRGTEGKYTNWVDGLETQQRKKDFAHENEDGCPAASRTSAMIGYGEAHTNGTVDVVNGGDGRKWWQKTVDTANSMKRTYSMAREIWDELQRMDDKAAEEMDGNEGTNTNRVDGQGESLQKKDSAHEKVLQRDSGNL